MRTPAELGVTRHGQDACSAPDFLEMGIPKLLPYRFSGDPGSSDSRRFAEVSRDLDTVDLRPIQPRSPSTPTLTPP